MDLKKLHHYTSIEDALTALFGNDVKIKKTERITGGDINQACRLTLTDGTQIFMKSNIKENADFFTAEAAGLSAIAGTGAVGTPHIFGCGTDDGMNCSFLLLEFISGKPCGSDYWKTFANQLSDMHKADTDALVSGGKYGFISDNYIGAREQINTAKDKWIDFFRECRLEPQFKAAERYFTKSDLRNIDRLLNRLDDILIEPEHPSLLHGDLWSGNVITGNDGRAWLIDPAAYVGHAEADIAMTELFGGFPPAFYNAYNAAASLQPGYERRRDVYNLYQLLNHLNMFGQTYLPSVLRIIDMYCGSN